MKTTLIESRAHRSKNGSGMGISAAVHFTVIMGAVAATATGTLPAPEEQVRNKLIWVKTTPTRQSSPGPAAPRAVTSRSSDAVRPPASVSLSISPGIPDVTIPLGTVGPRDFAAVSPMGSSGTDSPRTGGGGSGPYDPTDVDTQVSAPPNSPTPEYPRVLRNSGVEGYVTAQFVVGSDGRTKAGSIRILSSTNDLFSSAVENALMRMKFNPARIGGAPVAQTVQQMFAFRLDR